VHYSAGSLYFQFRWTSVPFGRVHCLTDSRKIAMHICALCSIHVEKY